jgi:uncharacterized protein
VAGVLVAAVVFVVALLWAKWLPYAARASSLPESGAWSGSSVLSVGGVRPGHAPSWNAAMSFTAAYIDAVWKALAAALLISAALQAFVPRTWLLRLLNRRGRVTSALAGGFCSTPSMMCTCCTAPVAVSLRRSVITLPAVSLPGIAMVGRALGWRTTAATAAMVVAGGLLGAGLLTVL